MSQSTGYVLGLIKDPKLNPFYLLRNVTDRTIYNLTTIGLQGRMMYDLPDATHRRILTASINSFHDYDKIIREMVVRSISDSYIVIDKFDMVADLIRKKFLSTPVQSHEYANLSRFELDHYRDILIPLITNGNRIILVSKPRTLYSPNGKPLHNVGFSGLKRTDYWCHDICYFMNTEPCTLLMQYTRYGEYRPFLQEPTIERIEEILNNDAKTATNETTTD